MKYYIENPSGIFNIIFYYLLYTKYIVLKIIEWFLDLCYFFNIIYLVYRSNKILY